jgi:hypothetical protein
VRLRIRNFFQLLKVEHHISPSFAAYVAPLIAVVESLYETKSPELVRDLAQACLDLPEKFQIITSSK